jgi:hypothetical protein
VEQGELERLRAHYADLSNEELVRIHGFGPQGFREAGTWELVSAEHARRMAEGRLPDAAVRAPATSLATPAASSPTAGPEYKGVGGWLFLLCLGLTIFSPLIALLGLARGYREGSQYFAQYPGLLTLTALDTLLVLGLLAFSIYAGTGLWTLRPGAVRMAKRYLLCFLGYQAVALFLPLIAGLPSEVTEGIIAQATRDGLRGLLYVAVWHSYLSKSKRVRATYGV